MGTNITGIGNANAIGFKSRVTGGAYFPPELKDALVGVWSAYGKSNDSTDRNIIKNKIKDRGGDFVISNAAYEGMSGYNGYPIVFGANKTWEQMPTGTFIWNIDDNKLHITKALIAGNGLLFSYVKLNGSLLNVKEIPSFKIKVSGLEGKSKLWYRYLKTEDAISETIAVLENGTHELPKSYIPSDSLHNGVWVGFTVTPISEGVKEFDCDITIEVLPEYEGAFVTDGVDDLITSTKTMQEMLGGSNEITVVSMIHQIGFISSRNYARNNYFIQGNDFLTNTISAMGKIGIYGYKGNLSNIAIVNDILGDKKDYSVDKANPANIDSVFSVNGTHSSAQLSQVAWYWTFIANRVLTEDEINLVIEKYNLDRPGEIVKPQVYYNVKKQKISNDNHSAFDDKLIDYSGNGYDAKLYNFGWKEDSGIGKYGTDFTSWLKSIKITSFDSESFSFISDVNWTLLYYKSNIGKDMPSFKVKIKLDGDGVVYYNYITQEGILTNVSIKTEEFETPISYNTKYTGETPVNVGFTMGVRSGECSGTITQIPEYENALVFDGIDDYGKVTGLPILKDYTVAADYIRTFAKENAQDSPILSKSKVAGSGAFLFNYLNADSITSSYSFGTDNILKEINDSERKIYYLSKYASDGHNVNAGSAVDYDTMWLGTYRDNISNFFTGALYFAMLFPYSLSEFLLERQIKKARAGTLYSNQVEFRPIIPEDENITRIDYFVVDSGIWKVIKPGDYVDVGARIVLNVYTKLPYKIAGASSTAFTGMTVGPSTGLNIFDVKGYIKDKTPQKIKLTLAVNEDIVQWNPAITSNLLDSFTASSWYLNGWDNTLTAGTWIKKTDRVFFKATFKTELYGLETATFGGTECVVSKADNWSDSKNIWDIRMLGTAGDLSQIFNLDVYELIRFEDIVQPYPVLLRFKDENGNEVSWGGKFRVGSTITRIGSAADSNLLPNIYNIFGLLLNDNQVTSSKVIVEKTMVFKAKSAYIFDNNEPKCILSPSRLRIPNSSYKLLGYIPDISGHGNNGKINNSAYEGMSGANGYPVVFGENKTWANESNGYVTSITSNTIHITNVLNAGLALLYSYVKYNGNLQNIKEIPPFKIEIKGLEGRSKFIYKYLATSDATKETNLYLGNGTHELPKSFLPTEALINNAVIGFSISPIEEGVTNFLSDITIKVLSEYEGAYCLDGVDDFVTIPTLSSGGKQVLMKVNSRKSDCYLYDQRNNWTQYLGIVSTKDFMAYNYSNQRGKTYIDGILNENITANDLVDITHNITVTNNRDDVKQYSPCIGTSFARNSFAQMALYDFMLFDNISTDDKIKELNEYIGLSGNIFEFNPTFTIDLPMAIKSIKVYQGGNEISPGYLYPNKDTEFEVYVSLNDGKYAVDTITVDGVEITKDRVVGEYNIFKFILNGSSEQKIKIHSYEYIMYEDINQPYPVIFKVKDRTTNQIYSWGDRIKIGSSIQLIHGENPNLLPELYSIISYTYEGNSYSYNQLTNLVITVTKTISVSCQKTWKLGSNEPKCILSPKRLKLANSSYKYLGYIPDISGNGNNGAFTNFAFSGMSGAGGYVENFNDWIISKPPMTVEKTDSQAHISYIGTSYKTLPMFEYTNPKVVYNYTLIVEITGIPDGCVGKFIHVNTYTQEVANGINTIRFQNDAGWFGFTFYREDGVIIGDCNITIKQIGNYEGAICFDGIDDYVDIPSLSIGGKQVLMKTNWLKSPTLLYDQRASGSFAILTTKEGDANNPRIAYQARNQDGKTYIDGIENNYIETYSLKGITHNITVTNPSAGSGVVPVIGANTGKSSGFAKMALYDFMLFDEVSTNEEIKQLNDIVGIEGNYVQKPPYYWDTHGKSNLDGDRGTIPQLGTAEDYSFTSFDNEIDWYLSSSNYIDVVSRNGYKITLKNLSTGIDGWRFQNSTVKRFILNDIPFKIKSNKTIRVYWDMHYNAISSTELRQKVVSVTTINPNEDTLINLRHLTEEELTELNVNKSTMYYLLWFDVSTLAVNEEVTVEMLPVEGGRNLWLNNYGFAYDKMSGFGGYEFEKFTDTTKWIETKREDGIEVIEKNDYSFTAKKVGTGQYFWDFKNNSIKTLDRDLTVKAISNNNVYIRWEFKYRTAEKPDIDSAIILLRQAMTPNVPITVTLPYKTQEEQTELGVVEGSTYYLFYFDPSDIPVGDEYTVEMLPLYPNGLVYDGVDDYSENISIPAFTDYTYIFKRTLLNKKYNSASVFKGSNQQSGGGAFICDYNSVEPELMIQGYSFGAGLYANSLNTNDIVYGTKNSVNGQTITSGNNADTEGLTIGKWRAYKQMVFYKLMLYPRTTDMLTINMIKNMMAEDGIIDIQGKLFTDKFTGDFNLDFNKDFLIGN